MGDTKLDNTKLTYGQWVLITSIVAMSVVLAFLLDAIQGLWTAWWLYPAWDWFLVPLGLPPITLWHFWALMLLIRFRRMEMSPKEPKETKKRTTTEYVISFSMQWLKPILIWAILRWLVEAK